MRLTYTGLGTGTPKLMNDEHTEVGWFSKEELRNMKDLDRYVRELLDRNLF